MLNLDTIHISPTMATMTIYTHKEDLSMPLEPVDSVAVDTETLGLSIHRDRLCVVQFALPNGECHVVHFSPNSTYNAPNLKAFLSTQTMTKIFHYARFDVAILHKYLNIDCMPLYCTKVASKIARTFTNHHGLKHLCHSLLNIDISKEEQSSYWGADTLSSAQKDYACNDVRHLHALQKELDHILAREGRMDIAKKCFPLIHTAAILDLKGFDTHYVMSH